MLYAAWSLGWWGPCLLTSALLAALIFVLLRAARGGDAFLQSRLLAALGMMLLLLHVGSLLRPHLVSYLCLAALGAFLIKHREPRSWTEFWPMALLQVAWTNCHSAFVIGPAMVGLFGFESIVRRWRRTSRSPARCARVAGRARARAAGLLGESLRRRALPAAVRAGASGVDPRLCRRDGTPARRQRTGLLLLPDFLRHLVRAQPSAMARSVNRLRRAGRVFFPRGAGGAQAWPSSA